MKPENAIEVKDITRSFKVYLDRGKNIKEFALFKKRRKYVKRDVLKGISFEVKKGEAVGLIGHNGCGKSTTLKMLTRILYPETGTIAVAGRVSSLIELGAGFHPDMSGRENIYINAAIFGLNKKEIDRRVEDIIAFSELEEFIDSPVRTYSSGMYMRLAFSVAINVDAEVLLIDEILAVGDANFQAKCFNKLREIKANGTTIVIVSHSLGQIEQICERSIWIHEGLIRMEGSPREVHPVYLDYMGQKRQEVAEKEAERKAAKEQQEQKEQLAQADARAEADVRAEAEDTEAAVAEAVEEVPAEEAGAEPAEKKRWGNGMARITEITLLDKDGKAREVFETGSDITVRLAYRVKAPVKNAVFGIGIFRTDGVQCYGTNTRIDSLPEFSLEKDGVMELSLKNVMLMPGVYTVDVAIESDLGIPVDYFREAKTVEFYSKDGDVGLVKISHSWKLGDVKKAAER